MNDTSSDDRSGADANPATQKSALISQQKSQQQDRQKDNPQAAELTLIDGYGYVFRAFYALPPMARKDGTPVNAVYGFTRMLALLLRENKLARCLVVFDAEGKSFRSDIYPEYKAQRRETPPELIPQFKLVRDAALAFSLPIVEHKGFEADDLIASYTRKARAKGWNVEIYSSDKDLMQLINKNVWLRDPVKARVINEEAAQLKFGVPPRQIKDVMALAGDASDNIPGVPGIGVKTAAELITRFGNLENLLAQTAQISQPKRREALQNNLEKARISMKLVTLAEDAPCTITLDSLEKPKPVREKLGDFLRAQNFISLLRELETVNNGKGSGGLGGLFPSVERKPVAAEREPAAAKVIVFENDSPSTTSSDTDPDIVSAAPSATYEPLSSVSVINDSETLAVLCDKAREQGLCALAVETTSANIIDAELVGVALCLEGNVAAYIPLAHRTEEATRQPSQLPTAVALKQLRLLFEDRSILKVAHNLKKASAVLQKYATEVVSYDDTILLSATLDGGKHGSAGHELPALAERHLKYKPTPYKNLVGTGLKAVNFARVPIDVASAYLADAAAIALQLHKIFSRRLIPEKAKGIYETLERPLIPVVVAMERRGVRIDSEVLQSLSKNFAQRLAKLEKEIHELAGEEFVIASPKQLGEVLFARLNLSRAKKTASGQFSTESSVLEKLADQGHSIATKVLDWRRLSKLRSTYTEALPRQVQKQTQRVHTSFSLSAAQTGRLASSEPNLQNIPIRDDEGRQIRRAFIAAQGCRLITLDYSQIELRLIASIAEVEAMLDSFAQGRDIHSATAAEMFGVSLSDVSTKQRRYAKTVNFSLLYGISRFGLARRLSIGEAEAQDMINLYFARYPQLRSYRERTIAFCRANHYVETLFGRRIHLPAIGERNHHIRAHAERQAINAPVQGTAADIVKQAMIRLHRSFNAQPSTIGAHEEDARASSGVHMLLQVHDEIILEAPLGITEDVARKAQKIMTAAAQPQQSLPITLEVSYRIGDNWLAA